jgi:DNA-binding winged helix-turn-helix (wHTH) protein/tetratricopeptide (TPR) repeat protein
LVAPIRPSPEAVAGTARIWLFGDVRLDERTLELQVRGAPVRLHRKPLLVLLYLLQHPNEVVTKDELAEACWPRRILSETVLTSTLNRLRQALGDEHQEIIKTIHGFGYRLTPAVRIEEVEQSVAPRLTLHAGDHPPLRPLWSLVERLGGGGSGELWLARHDKTGDERVYKFAVDANALKAIKREITLYRLLRESVGERADLVRIFDWNLEHSPFFVEFEYVPGGDVRQWSQAQGGLTALPPATRLDLVAQCADVLAVAHGVGVLHKDLKPANVLVADPGPPVRIKLTDFGSGALVDATRLERLGITRLGYTASTGTSDHTGSTPLYTPPEVLAGQPATVQADIYALGVMLYQAVAGDWNKPLAPGWEREVPDALLREDIAAAVDGDPARRLADAAELARRLRSLDARREQRARDDAERQRAQRLQEQLARTRLQRRWTLVTMALFAAGFAVTFVLYWQLHNSERGRAAALAEAQHEAAASAQINDYLTSLFEAASPEVTDGKPLQPRALVDAGQAQIADRFRDQPLLRARLLGTVGSLYCTLELPGDCRKNLEQALALENANGGADPLIQARHRYWLAQAFAQEGHWGDAEKTLREIMPLFEARLAPTDSLSIGAGILLGTALLYQQKSNEAIAVLEQTRAVLRGAQDNDRPDAVEADRALVRAYLAAGRVEAAVKLAEARMPALRERVGPDALSYISALQGTALAHYRAGQLDLAEKEMREAIAGYRRILGDDAHATSVAEGSLVTVLDRANKLPEAIEWEQRIVDDRRRRYPDSPTLAVALGNLGGLRARLGAYEQALPLLREAYDITLHHFNGDDLQIHVMRHKLGHLLTDMHRYPEALALLTPEVPPSLKSDPSMLERTRRLLLLGDCYTGMGRYTEARQYYDEAETRLKTDFKPGDSYMADSFRSLDHGRLYLLFLEKRYPEALPGLRDLVNRSRSADPPGVAGPATLALEMELAETLAALHQNAEAAALVKQRAEAIRQLAPTHPAYQSLQRLQAELHLT